MGAFRATGSSPSRPHSIASVLFAANVRDAATLLGVIAGHDPQRRDQFARRRWKTTLPRATSRRKVCASVFRRSTLPKGLDAEVRAAIEKGIAALETAGCAVKKVSLPHTKYAVPTYYLVATAEASANLARFDGVRYGYRSPHSDDSFRPCIRTRATRASERRSSAASCSAPMRSPPATTTRTT
jgi:Asp-tRNA(Asn)/Glu-tRNA(Gln) amidotransferase A subunit family amidase